MIQIGVADWGMTVWDGGIYDIQERLETVRGIGFDGIERLEAVSEADALHKAALFKRMGMDFATCRGPSVQVGMEWTAALSKKYVWLCCGEVGREVEPSVYLRRARQFCRTARRWGLRPALHNHLGQRIQNPDELDLFMTEVPEADLLLDVGHLFAAGGDPAAALRQYPNRIAAIHLKDIRLNNPSIGLDRWKERLQFCAMGEGNAGFDLEAVLHAIHEIGYDGWIHVEQDTHETDCTEELNRSYRFIRKHLPR